MHDFWALFLTALAGSVLGAIFFGGLWWTVSKSLSSQRTALWLIGSLILRMTIVLAGFYWIGGDRWERYLAGFVGFFLARIIVTKFTLKNQQNYDNSIQH